MVNDPRITTSLWPDQAETQAQVTDPRDAGVPEFDTDYDTEQALADVRRIATWLAEDTDSDDAQGAASDLNAAVYWLGSHGSKNLTRQEGH